MYEPSQYDMLTGRLDALAAKATAQLEVCVAPFPLHAVLGSDSNLGDRGFSESRRVLAYAPAWPM